MQYCFFEFYIFEFFFNAPYFFFIVFYKIRIILLIQNVRKKYPQNVCPQKKFSLKKGYISIIIANLFWLLYPVYRYITNDPSNKSATIGNKMLGVLFVSQF